MFLKLQTSTSFHSDVGYDLGTSWITFRTTRSPRCLSYREIEMELDDIQRDVDRARRKSKAFHRRDNARFNADLQRRRGQRK